MELILTALFIAVAIGMIVYAMWPKGAKEADAITRRAAGERANMGVIEDKTSSRAAVKMSILEKAAPMLSRPFVPKTEGEQTTLKLKLAGAGFRNESAPMVFLASKTITAVGLGIVAVVVALQFGKPMTTVAGYFVFAAGIGFMLPEGWLYMVRKQRIEAIRNGLPDSLDLMVVSVEAGLALDAALMRVGDEMRLAHPPLSEEMQIATLETQMGIHRSEALQKMANRTGVEEMKALVAVISQAEKLGTSIAKALRTQADALRTKRRQRAEERAQKTAVKLMLPLILFIFPAILIVLGVPAGIKLAETLSGTGPLAGS